MIELNLLPDVKKEFIKAQKTRNMVVSGAILVSIIAGSVVALLATTVYGGQKVFIDNLKKEVVANHTKLQSKDEIDKLLAIQSQLKNVADAGKQRSLYGRSLDYLLQLNPSSPYNVSLYDFALTKVDMSMKFSGSASTFETVNNFKYTLENAKVVYKDNDGKDLEVKMFTSIIASPPALSNTSGKSLVAFTFSVIFAPEIFDPAVKDPKVSVPKLTTSDGDQNAPKDLFTVKPVEEKPGDTNGN